MKILTSILFGIVIGLSMAKILIVFQSDKEKPQLILDNSPTTRELTFTTTTRSQDGVMVTYEWYAKYSVEKQDYRNFVYHFNDTTKLNKYVNDVKENEKDFIKINVTADLMMFTIKHPVLEIYCMSTDSILLHNYAQSLDASEYVKNNIKLLEFKINSVSFDKHFLDFLEARNKANAEMHKSLILNQ